MNKIQVTLISRLNKNTRLSNIKTVAIPLCFRNPKNHKDGCWCRFKASVHGLNPEETIVIQTGGTEKMPLCEIMKGELPFMSSNWIGKFLSIPLGWGTRSEIANAFSVIRALSSNHQLIDSIDTRKDSGFKVVIASNREHLKRIKWYVDIYNWSEMQIEYREAEHHFSLKDIIREKIGLPLIQIHDLIIGRKNLIEEQERDFHMLIKNLSA